jgi:hypothetical protein
MDGDSPQGKWRRNMALDDYMEPEVAVTAVVTAAIFSPQIRGLLRRGLVYGLAGAMIVGDTVTSFAKSVGEGVQQAGASAAQAAQTTVNQAKEQAHGTQGEQPQQQTQSTEHNKH